MNERLSVFFYVIRNSFLLLNALGNKKKITKRLIMKKNLLETLMGVVVLAVAGVFLVFAYEGSQLKVVEGYNLKGKFANATGISVGSDIRIGGIKVGVVSQMDLDPDTYEAIVSMQISKDTKLPKDTSAAISSSGLLGSKFVQLTPGGDDRMLKEGGRIQYTQSSVSLEELIGKFMFSGGGVDSKDGDKKTEGSKASTSMPTLR